MVKTEIGEYASKKIWQLRMDCENTGGDLARLDHGIGKRPGEDPVAWGLVFSDAPEILLGTGRSPSHAEEAIYAALTLYAKHQKGLDAKENSMHVKGRSFGAAMRLLAAAEGSRGGTEHVKKRFNAVTASQSVQEAVSHMRSTVELLRRKGIGQDYAGLAKDLYDFVSTEEADSVRLAWCRDFYRI